MSERQFRMKQLGLNERQYTIYKALYNGVSINEKDRSINSGEQMYVKFAKFLTEPEIVKELYLTAITDEYIDKINKKVLEDNKVALNILKDK